MKPKAPTQSPEQLLREAERAYHAYQFGPASTALSKYISSLQRRRQAVPDSITMLQEQIARAERMYGAADELRVVDSTLVGIDRIAELLPQGSGRFLVAEQLPADIRSLLPVETPVVGDSLQPASPVFPTFGFVDALGRNSIIPDAHALAWYAKAGRSWERQGVATKTLEADAPIRSPFLLEDGMTLFFARRSPAGLGGYDLYMTRLTEQGNSFFEPTLLGMPYTPPTTTICSLITRAKAGGSSSVTASLPRGRSTSIASLAVLPSSLVVRVVRRQSSPKRKPTAVRPSRVSSTKVRP